ncbi:MAG: hypothetical protein ACE145_20930 [Terriglobia bacterium]
MAAEKSEKLPGMPGPTQQRIEQREKIQAAIQAIHDALLPSLEALPVGDVKGAISIRMKIRGDTVTVTLKPGSED